MSATDILNAMNLPRIPGFPMYAWDEAEGEVISFHGGGVKVLRTIMVHGNKVYGVSLYNGKKVDFSYEQIRHIMAGLIQRNKAVSDGLNCYRAFDSVGNIYDYNHVSEKQARDACESLAASINSKIVLFKHIGACKPSKVEWR